MSATITYTRNGLEGRDAEFVEAIEWELGMAPSVLAASVARGICAEYNDPRMPRWGAGTSKYTLRWVASRCGVTTYEVVSYVLHPDLGAPLMRFDALEGGAE